MGRKRPSVNSRMSIESPHPQEIEISSDEEDEANEDLSLGILAKAKGKKRPPPSALEIISSDEDKNSASPWIGTLDEPQVVSGAEVSGEETCLEQDVEFEMEAEVLEENPNSTDVKTGSLGEMNSKKKRKKKKRQKTNLAMHLSTPEVTGMGSKEVAEIAVTQKRHADDQNQYLHLSILEDVGTETKEVGENAVMRKLLRGPRYFDPPEEQEQLCYHCGESGHVSVNCTMERRKKPCYVCGNVGHGAKDCQQGTECYICKKVGHIARNCTEQRLKGDRNSRNFAICLRCGDIGHDMASCQNDYNPEDLKQIQCYVCKCFGHLCCIDVMDNSSREPSCYNCGEKGHTGLGCAKERRRKGNEGPAKKCYRCGEEGHFARGCRRDANFDRWKPDATKPGNEWSQEDANFFGLQSVPRDFGKLPRWTDAESEVRKAATPGDLRSRHGWTMNHEDMANGTPRRTDTWDSPAGILGFGGWEMGSASSDHHSTSKTNISPNSGNGSHHSYGLRNKYSAPKNKKRDGWWRAR